MADAGSEQIDTGEAVASTRLFALKHGDTFVVADVFGDISGLGDGLFHHDTRLLSRFRVRVAEQPLMLLGGAIGEDNVLFTANLTNLPLAPIGGQSSRQGVIHVERARVVWEDRLYERLRVHNYAEQAAYLPLRLEFAADFRDMFEVRGLRRSSRGQLLAAQVKQDSVVLSYRSLDGLLLTSALAFSSPPTRLSPDCAEIDLDLPPRVRTDVFIEVGLTLADTPSRMRFRTAVARARTTARTVRRRGGSVRTSGRVFNEWLARSRADLALLTTELPTGPYPYAGIPWFSTTFGRDAIITALQILWLDPSLARGVLRYLAEHQATETSRFYDAAPGKIMHETRKGEMARLHELPFGKYYGGVDTTPLFVMLAGAYARRSGDLAFVDELWPSLLAAMAWIEGDGDTNRDGFVDYARGTETGLANQGWKDSEDSVFDNSGCDVAGPIALVEVQGYVFAAFRAMAGLARRRGDSALGVDWDAKAELLQSRVEAQFWLDDIGTYALALDGAGRPCRVRTSNPGHLLFTGLPASDRAERVTSDLLGCGFNTGWGIRTLARGEPRYNPMSYHNGSVWPHDTAMCIAGMARYGVRASVVQLISGMFESAVRFGMRLPELYCGFERRPGEPPIAYPVACLPQAWASGSLFMMLQACLGLSIDGWRGEIHLDRPQLPVGIDHLTIVDLPVGDTKIRLNFDREGDRVSAYSEGRAVGTIPVIMRA